jgi:hypothetical protein
VTRIMDRIFKQNGSDVANDLIVPRESVYAANGHPSFPILNPLLYSRDSGVWHSGFFAQARTIADIEDKVLQLRRAVRVEMEGTLRTPKNLGPRSPAEKKLGRLLRAPDDHPPPYPRSTTRPRRTVDRRPQIDFHEVVMEGQASDLRCPTRGDRPPSEHVRLVQSGVRSGRGCYPAVGRADRSGIRY